MKLFPGQTGLLLPLLLSFCSTRVEPCLGQSQDQLQLVQDERQLAFFGPHCICGEDDCPEILCSDPSKLGTSPTRPPTGPHTPDGDGRGRQLSEQEQRDLSEEQQRELAFFGCICFKTCPVSAPQCKTPSPTSAKPTQAPTTQAPTTQAPTTASPTNLLPKKPTEAPSHSPSGSPSSGPTIATGLFFINPVANVGNDTVPKAELITNYKWLIVESNTGSYEGTLENPPPGCSSTDQGYPQACEWPSIRNTKAHAPIYSSGDSTEWGPTTGLEIPDSDKRYMVTVMAEGYRLCGGYFSAGHHAQDVTVNVICVKHPLPLGTIRLFVFEDTMPTNGQYDPGERPLNDFGIGINDIEGPITEDYYGNDLLSLVTDENGMLEVPNMWPQRYDIDVGPPPQSGWIKTNTLEGGHGWDYWLYEGWDGYDNEFVIGNEKFPFMVAGFVKVFNDLDPVASTVELSGTIKTVSPWPSGINFAEVTNLNQNVEVIGKVGRDKGPLFNEDGIYCISDMNFNDQAVVCDTALADGTFSLMIPPGDYSISFFDIAQTYILQTKTFTVPQAPSFDLGDLFLTGWYTEIEGFFFLDDNENGIFEPDLGEIGLHNGPFPVLRLRDGTQIDRGLQFEVPFNDPQRLGFYSFRHTYPLASWMALHAFHPLYKMTGCTYKTEQQTENTTKVAGSSAAEDSIAFFGTPGVNTRLDVGFKPNKDLNASPTTGTIIGSVVYDTTRVNLDAAASVVENHEPGIPGIKVNLFRLPDKKDPTLSSPTTCDSECQFDLTAGFGYYCLDEGHQNNGKKCTRFYVGAEFATKPFPVVMWTHVADGTGYKAGELVYDIMDSTPLKTATTTQFEAPRNCVITDQYNEPLLHQVHQGVLPDPTPEGVPCIETPLLRNQVGGFTELDGSFKFTDLEPGYYAIQVEIPKEIRGDKDAYKVRCEHDINAFESDLFVGVGLDGSIAPECPSASDQCPLPADASPPLPPNRQNYKMPCAGKTITVKTAVDLLADNPSFSINGGSHAYNKTVNYCDIKIVKVEANVNNRATFHLFTDVPIPSLWRGVVLDDMIPQTNPDSTLYTELLGVPKMPVGIYDFRGTKLTDVTTDPNGYFEVFVPASRNNAVAPSASGLMAGMWCMTANDPGTRAHPSASKPLNNYRAITACFEALPGRIVPVDLAPVTLTSPISIVPPTPTGRTGGGSGITDVPCGLPPEKPELFLVAGDGPICTTYPCTLEIRGRNFGPTTPMVQLLVPSEQETGPYVNPTPVPIPAVTVLGTDFSIPDYDSVTIQIAEPVPFTAGPNASPTNSPTSSPTNMPTAAPTVSPTAAADGYGIYQLELQNAAGHTWMSGITIHITGSGTSYDPVVYDSRNYVANQLVTHTAGPIQRAIDDWESSTEHSRGGLIMIYPIDITSPLAVNNADRAHMENLIMSFPPVKLQGIGPGGGTITTLGTTLNGGNFGAGGLCAPPELFCDAQSKANYQDSIVAKAANLKATRSVSDGTIVHDAILNNGLVEGPVLYVFGDYKTYQNGPLESGWDSTPMALIGGIDGCQVTGGVQLAEFANIGPVVADEPQITTVQGGGITLHTYVRYFRITNNAIKNNGGTFAGGIRVGTALMNQQDGSGTSFNSELTVSHNSILYNGAFNLGGGAIGLYGGSNNYVIKKNHICGNGSQEYGGAISHFGTSNGGLITENWILWNRGVDEGGGIIIASEKGNLNAGVTVYPDAGDVNITYNVIQGCTSGDDGGGIRFLNSGLSTYYVHGNLITHNVAMHEGGGVSINDAPYVYFFENVVMNNIVTGTALESNLNQILAAGLAVNVLTTDLKAQMDLVATYSDVISMPQNFSGNVFWDNRASNGAMVGDGTLASPRELQGLGMHFADIYDFDIGSATGAQLEPSNSLIQNAELYEGSCDPPLPTEFQLGSFVLNPPPITCDTTNTYSAPDVVQEIKWGQDTITVRVLGLAMTLAGTNTFQNIVDMSLFPGGPIGDYSFVGGGGPGPGPSVMAAPPKIQPVEIHPVEVSDGFSDGDRDSSSGGSNHAFLWLLVTVPVAAVAVFAYHAVKAKKAKAIEEAVPSKRDVVYLEDAYLSDVLLEENREEVPNDEDGDKEVLVGRAKPKRAAGRFFPLVMVASLFSKQATADPGDCSLDCVENFTAIAPQEKYMTELFIPPVIDMRNRPCNETVDLYIKQAYQDFGVKDANGGTLLTPIYGYADHPDSDPTYPGPTFIVEKDCAVNVAFHNMLGIGPHMFPIDRSVDCGANANLSPELCATKTYWNGAEDVPLPTPPEGADADFYCRCVSEHGSERRTTTHLHGGHLLAMNDGHPDTWYTQEFFDANQNLVQDGGRKFSTSGMKVNGYNHYPNDQYACTLFYHDHAMGITRLNVYSGLAGLYLIEDAEKTITLLNYFFAAGLEEYEIDDLITGRRDIGLALADKVFGEEAGTNGHADEAHLIFPTGVKDGDGGGLPPFSILPELFGYTMTVNGVIYPYMQVYNDGYYHFRLLNACDSRFLRLFFELDSGDRVPFTVIASEQGLLETLVTVDEIFIGPAERYEIIVSFADLTTGTNVTLRNSEITLLGPVVEDEDDRFMQFQVITNTTYTSTTSMAPAFPAGTEWIHQFDQAFKDLVQISRPEYLNGHILNDFVNKREVWITERTSVGADIFTATGGRPLPMLGSRAQPFGEFYTDPITEEMIQHKPTVWELVNLSNDMHVIHLHQVRFLIIDRQDVGLTYQTFQHPHGMYRQYAKNPEVSTGYEHGPKDVLVSYPGTVTRLIVVFDIHGEFVWHCHIISHEDHMMLRELIVYSAIPSSAYIAAAELAAQNYTL